MNSSFRSPKKWLLALAVLVATGVAVFLGLRHGTGLSGVTTTPSAQNGFGQDHGRAISSASVGAPVVTPAAMDGAPLSADGAPAGQTQAGTPTIQMGSPTVSNVAPAEGVAVESCFNLAFHHKTASGHTDSDACSSHRNVLRIKNADLNKKSLCVRVDGVPVKYELTQDKKDTLATLGPIAGPASKITVRYCVGKATCKEDCTIPKDEFMEAIGGDDADSHKEARRGPAVKWDSHDNEKDGEVSEELEGEIERELASEKHLTVFDGWIQDSETAACSKLAQQ